MGGLCAKFLLIILSVFCPPIAVWIARNKICSGTVCINLLLTILGWVNIFIYEKKMMSAFFFYSRFPELFMLGVLSVAVTILMLNFKRNKIRCLYSVCVVSINKIFYSYFE